jgi:hypothetical protein
MAEGEKQSFLFLDEPGRRVAKLKQEWAKWFLDLLRNFLVVALLFVLAEKAHKWYVWALAFAGFFALYVYIMAYVDSLTFYLGMTKQWWSRLLLVVGSFLIVVVVSYGSIIALQVAVLEIARVQRMP